ncbi:thioredoxin family protein [Alkalihalobacillus sp. CinArs1]|uniref:thioredoxin family protein n=1 Tax=Alkalihalobacillus sp. CinArs1 TaxID=2995314 RepID=UPI0022DD23A3|nr:thioredoxin family protein [Alkalihalobacillus sp. CinArs1]
MQQIESKQSYDNLINDSKVTILKYEANWCPDCKRLDLFIDDIIKEHSDKQWAQIDIEQFPEITEENEVMGIPSLLVYKDGKKVGHLHSANTKNPDQVKNYLSDF